ncbi:MAG: hypothetical protein ACYCSQ_00505 [bacterium]
MKNNSSSGIPANENESKSRTPYRNLFTRVVPDKREKIEKAISEKEIADSIKQAEDRAWDEWEELHRRAGKIIGNKEW